MHNAEIKEQAKKGLQSDLSEKLTVHITATMNDQARMKREARESQNAVDSAENIATKDDVTSCLQWLGPAYNPEGVENGYGER